MDKQIIIYNNKYNIHRYINNFQDNNLFNLVNEKVNYYRELYNSNLQIENNSQEIIDDNDDNLDVWDEAINDNKFYINNKIARIFPYMKKFNNYGNLKIDDESFSFITIREIADLISKIICSHLLKFNINPQKINLIDYTAGVGGNILSFCKFFNYVYAIEISKQRAEFLENNIDVYGFKNIKIINECAIEFNNNKLIEINPDVIFIDPPWGGNEYKNNDVLLLKLGEMNIEDLILNICNQFNYIENNKIEENEVVNNKIKTKLIVLKLPRNYDIEHFYNKINNNYDLKIFIYILNKMIILICELKI